MAYTTIRNRSLTVSRACTLSYAFLPHLAIQSKILNKLTTKDAKRLFPMWSKIHQNVFDTIKEIVVSCECLTVINHSKLKENKFFVTTDASNLVTGAVMSLLELCYR